MNKFIFIPLLTVAFLSCYSSSGQTHHEIGLQMYRLDNFGFIYKRSKNDKVYTRHRLAMSELVFNRAEVSTHYRFSLAYHIGFERRKSITEKLQFIHGFEPGIQGNYSHSHSVSSSSHSFFGALHLGYILGFMYDISPDFYVAMETVPSLSFFSSTASPMFQTRLGFNSQLMGITLSYRFAK